MNQAQQVLQQYNFAAPQFRAGFTLSLRYGEISTGIGGVKVKMHMPVKVLAEKRNADGSVFTHYEYRDGSQIKATRSRSGEFKMKVEK